MYWWDYCLIFVIVFTWVTKLWLKIKYVPKPAQDENKSKKLRKWKSPNGVEYDINLSKYPYFWHTEMEAIQHHLKENGFVIIRGATNNDTCQRLRDRIQSLAHENPDAQRNGFLDFYHDDTLAQLRQESNIYWVFANLLGSQKLWVVFDRVIYQQQEESECNLTLLPHVDQNPITYPEFSHLQGMVALSDMNERTGVLSVVPKSPAFFTDYLQWVEGRESYIPNQSPTLPTFLGLCVKAGDLIIWDSRTTHSRYRESTMGEERYAALISFMKVPTTSNYSQLRQERLQYFEQGIGANNHEAGLRATASPRFEDSLRVEPEQLTLLGEKIYGGFPWDKDAI
jgi:hypothetical protein